VKVKLWLDNGNDVFMAELAPPVGTPFLKLFLGYTPQWDRDKTRSGGLFEKLFTCVSFSKTFLLVAVGSEGRSCA
jgi:hypothetical protein